MTMNEEMENPFDFMALARGHGLFGREDELAWLMKGIQEKAQLLLFGPEGMGKSSVLEQAGEMLAQRREGWMIRIDLALHRSTAEVGRVLQNATDELTRSPAQAGQKGVLGDAGKKPAPGAVALGKQISGERGGLEKSADLLQSLRTLNAFSLSQRRSVVVAFDSCHEMRRVGGDQLENSLVTAVESHSAMSHILCGDQHGLRTQSTEAMRSLQGAFDAQKLGPLEPQAFAQWIDRQFQSANIIARGVGGACVDLGGPNTAQAIELAQRAFKLSIRARFANEATVQTGLNQLVGEKKEQFAKLWQGLSTEEQSVILTVAKGGGQGLLESHAHRRCGLASDEQARSAIQNLVDKRLLDSAGSASVSIPSATMKHWALQAHLSIGRQQKTGGVSAQQLAFSLSFQAAPATGRNRTINP